VTTRSYTAAGVGRAAEGARGLEQQGEPPRRELVRRRRAALGDDGRLGLAVAERERGGRLGRHHVVGLGRAGRRAPGRERPRLPPAVGPGRGRRCGARRRRQAGRGFGAPGRRVGLVVGVGDAHRDDAEGHRVARPQPRRLHARAVAEGAVA
jgi:hypothetical protein